MNKDMCEFGRASLTYLGYTIGAGKISVPEARIKPILEYIKPRTQKHLKSFQGTVNYYRRFIPEFSHVSSRLSHAISTKMPQVIRWAPDMEEAFHLLCSKLANYVILHVLPPSDKFVVHVDSSHLGIGAELNVLREDQELPVAFFLSKIGDAQKEYSATELEVYGVLCAVKHWDYYLVN